MKTRSGPTMQVLQEDAGGIVLEKRRSVTEQEQQALREAEDFAEVVIDMVRVPLVVLDGDRRVVSANEAFYEAFQRSPEETVGCFFYALSNNAWDSPKLRELLDQVLPAEGAFHDVEIEQPFGRMGRRILVLNARRVEARHWTVLAIEDVTRQRKKGPCIQARAALHESERRFHNLFEASPDAIFVENLAGNILDVNPAACRLHHADRDTLIGANVYDLVPSDLREAVRRDVGRLIEGEVSFLQAYRWTVNQRAVPVEIRANRLVYDGQSAMLLIVRDISERIEVEEALKESQARAQAILETTVDAVVTIDAQGRIETANPAAERIFGYAAREMVGQNVTMLMPPPYRETHDQYIRRYLESGEKKVIGIGREVIGQRSDGSTFPMDLAVSEVQVETRRLFTGFIRDISERRRLEHEVLRISDEERQRIGRDLHDGLGSLLTGVAMGAQGLAQARSKGQDIRVEDLEHLAEMVEEGAAQAQALARGLNPVKLDDEGLSVALQELAHNARVLTKIACLFEAEGVPPVLNSVVSTQLYWIAQEALNNAVKHAHAKHIHIGLTASGDTLVLTIQDDGTGIPEAARPSQGAGLHIMPYRANLIGATFSIRAAPEGGTVVGCSLPLEKAIRTTSP